MKVEAEALYEQLYRLHDDHLMRAIEHVIQRKPLYSMVYGWKEGVNSSAEVGDLVGVSMSQEEFLAATRYFEPLEEMFDRFWQSYGKDESISSPIFEKRMIDLEAILIQEFEGRVGLKLIKEDDLVDHLLDD